MFRLCRVAYKPCVMVLALFLMLSPSACQSPQQAGNVTIRFAYPSQAFANPPVDQSLADRYKALAASFHEQNPNITVELVPLTNAQITALTAKDFDVLLLGNFYYSDYVDRGVLRSLAPWISLEDKAWNDDYLPTVLKPFERKGELWAIPWALDPLILYYNRDLFSQNGVEVPKPGWTWSDFLEKAHALTDIANGVFGSVIGNEYSLVPAIIYQHGGQMFDDWSQPTQATFDNPRNIEALSWLSSLIYEYNVMPTQAQAIRQFGSGTYALSTGIYKGKFGMWIADYIERGGAIWVPEDAWTVPWGAAPLPQDAQAATMVNAYLLGISSQAADADACWKWLAYLSQQLPPDLFLPARTSQREGLHPKDASEQEALSAGSAALEGVLLTNTDGSENVIPALTAFWQAVDAVLKQNESAGAQLQLAQQKATQ
jgi:ABC-type glycerol-3-phosphate transport system substrate-binding protein